MYRVIKGMFYTFILFLVFTGCKNHEDTEGVSLDSYFLDNQETVNFIARDMPVSMLKVDDSQFTEAEKEVFASVKHLNFLGFKVDGSNTEAYKVELAKVKRILKGKSYSKLMEFSDKGHKIIVKYKGHFNKTDELVVLGSEKQTGFGIVRVLGSDMNLVKLGSLAKTLQETDIDENQFEDIIAFFE